MGIYQRQYEKILAQELLKQLLLGRLPNLNDISKKIQDVLGNKDTITYKYVSQPTRELFRNEQYNKSLYTIKFDIDLLHDEILDLFSQSSARVNYADLYHKLNSYDLNRLKAQLEMLLFTTQQADFYFSGAFETFSDISKTNVADSTKDIVDLAEKCISLPYNGTATKRIPIYTETEYVPTITISNPNIVLSSRVVPGSNFNNIFSDTLSVWSYEVITNSNSPLSISVNFPLTLSSNNLEYFVSRFEFVPHSYKKQNILLTTSNDNVNYASILGYEVGMDISDQKVNYAMDFETTLVEYVNMTLSKQEADEEITSGSNRTYRYVFGLKRFSAMTTGRVQEATYISKPFTFKEVPIIGKISIESQDIIPNETKVLYYLATTDVDGNQLSPFIPISPVNSTSSVGVNKVISFGSSQTIDTKFSVTESGNDAAQTYGVPFQGKQFYRIGSPITDDMIFGSTLLYRGYKCWSRDVTGTFETSKVSDIYVTFSQSLLEAIYTTITEIPSIRQLAATTSLPRRSQLTVSKLPYYDQTKGHAIKPPAGLQNSSLDIHANYAVYKVLNNQGTSRKIASFTLSSQVTQYLPVDAFVTQSNNASDLPILRLHTGTIYVLGEHYIIETEDIGGQQKPTGRITIPEGSPLLDPTGVVYNMAVEFEYTPDPDITHKVVSIEGNIITLNNSLLTNTSPVEITYRYVPTSPSTIIGSSIRVSDRPQSAGSSRTFYVEGRDYLLDASTGTIQKLINGSIGSDVYVEYSYREAQSALNTFTTWCYISSDQGTQLRFDQDTSSRSNRLVVDATIGEAFYINTKAGLINLTNSLVTPILDQGWVQFIVKSKNPSTYTEYRTNLIDQVIQLKDTNKKKIFKEYSTYFNEIVAFRDPLRERTLNHLKVNTLLSDHTVFAVDSITDPLNRYLVINYLPTQTTELYCKVPTDDSDEDGPPASSSEGYRLVYVSNVSDGSAPSGVIVKIDLKRNQNVDGAVTPKVFEYKLRVGT